MLVVTMGIDYVAPARMPRELKRAGLRVGVLAPDGALALHTAGSVVEFVGIPAVAEATRALAARPGIHGFAGAQFLLDPDSGRPLLMEINRRMLPATHSGSWIGIDLAAALATAMRGERWSGPGDLPACPGLRLALFPQEWYREPSSHWLRELPCDVPWHDPALLVAMTRAAFPAVDTTLHSG